MAHLLVSNETTIVDHSQQENLGSRSIGKHRRTSNEDARLSCYEGFGRSGPDVTKRQALVSITNQPFANKKKTNNLQKKPVPPTKCSISGSLVRQNTSINYHNFIPLLPPSLLPSN